MDRETFLKGRISGPFNQSRDGLSWEFSANRMINHRLKSVTGRRFVLTYDTRLREFRVKGTRRMSKRNKRQEVKVSRRMLAHLRSRLSPQDIARCTMASLVGKAA